MKKFIFFLALIFFLGTVLRFYQLGRVPVELNRDEASLGYTAYALLQTGREEHGVPWPINIESFGDWKLPGYVYTLIPFIKVFGLKPWVVRLPSALAGSLIILLTGLITLSLSKNKKLSLLSALLVAISPWGIHLSHLAYEANLAMFFFLIGLICFIVGESLKGGPRKIGESNFWGLLFVFFWGLTLFTYHSYQIFTPLMLFALSFFYKKRFLSLLAIFFILILLFTSISANQTKYASLSILAKKTYSAQINQERSYFQSQKLAALYSNYPEKFLNQVQRNIANLFSARFFFFEGGAHGSHDIAGTGKMYPIEFIFLSSTAIYLLAKIKPACRQAGSKKLETYEKLILYWLLAASVAPLITLDSAHSIRFSPALPALSFLSAYGLSHLSLLFPSPIHRRGIKGEVVLSVISIILLYSTLNFLITYFVVAPQRDLNNWNWQIKTLTQLIKDKKNNFDHVIMPGNTWSPYIYFLFYWKYDPQLIAQNVHYQELTNEGFKHVKQLENIYFSKREDLRGHNLFVMKEQEINWDTLEKIKSGVYQLEYLLSNPNAKDVWYFYSYDR